MLASSSLWSVQVFVKNLEGKTTVHTVSWDTMLSEFVCDGTDVYAGHNGERLGVHQSDGKVGARDTIRFCGRLKCGALRQHQPDIPGQRTCFACGQRVWPTRPTCFRCGCPKSAGGVRVGGFTEGPQWPLGRVLQRVPPINPYYRPGKAGKKN